MSGLCLAPDLLSFLNHEVMMCTLVMIAISSIVIFVNSINASSPRVGGVFINLTPLHHLFHIGQTKGAEQTSKAYGKEDDPHQIASGQVLGERQRKQARAGVLEKDEASDEQSLPAHATPYSQVRRPSSTKRTSAQVPAVQRQCFLAQAREALHHFDLH